MDEPTEITLTPHSCAEGPVIAHLLRLLYDIGTATERYRDVVAGACRLNRTDLEALAALTAAAGGDSSLTPSELSAELHLSPPAVSALLNRMSRRGLIRRRPNPFDRRFVDIEVSQEAQAMIQNLSETIDRHTGHVLRGMTAEEILINERFLHNVCQAIAEAQGELTEPPAAAQQQHAERARA